MPSFVYLILISSLSCLAINYVPSLGYISGIVWGMSLLLGGKLLNDRLLMLMLGLNLLLLYGVSGSSNLFFILVFGIPSFVMGLLIIRNRNYYDIRKWAMLTAVVLVGMYIGVTYYNVGNPTPPDRQGEIDHYVAQNVKVLEDNGLLTFYEQQGISADEMKNDAALIFQWWFMHLPAFYYLEAIMAVYLVLSLGELIGRNRGNPILGRKPFREELMPWPWTGVIIVALFLWLWGRDDMNELYYAGSNLLLAVGPITIYYGLANLAFLKAKLHNRSQRWMLSMLIIGAVILAPPTIIFIALLGLFDSLLDYRKLNRVKEDRP